MKILYMTQHFPPETGAAQGRAFEISQNLVELGHDVRVVTGFPNYPTGVIQQGYEGKLYMKEEIGGVKVLRAPIIPDDKSSSLKRLANYFSYMFSSMVLGALFVRKPDVIIATSPQLFVGLSGYFLSKLHRAKFVFEVRDLWVDFAEGLGEFNNKRLLRWAKSLERFLYYKADEIVVVTEGYKAHLQDKEGVPSAKITVITNGVELERLKPRKDKEVLKKQRGLEGKFVVLYAGNIGSAQGLDVILDAAHQVKENEDIVFVMIGEGVEKEKLVARIAEERLTNVRVENGKSKNEILDDYDMADASVVSLKQFSLFGITLPSKLFDSMAMAKPTLIGVDGEGRKIVEEAEAGLYFEPGNGTDLAKRVLTLYQNPELVREMGQNARSYVQEKFSRKQLSLRLEQGLKRTVGNRYRSLFRFGVQNKIPLRTNQQEKSMDLNI